MYYENVNKTINVWRDGDVLHVFITAPNQKKYNQENLEKLLAHFACV